MPLSSGLQCSFITFDGFIDEGAPTLLFLPTLRQPSLLELPEDSKGLRIDMISTHQVPNIFVFSNYLYWPVAAFTRRLNSYFLDYAIGVLTLGTAKLLHL
jgi:hypothetical protein